MRSEIDDFGEWSSRKYAEWTELAYDFYQQGYDVLLFDHRGQGYSQRIIPQKGHLDEFRFYTDDMAKIIEKNDRTLCLSSEIYSCTFPRCFDFHLLSGQLRSSY